MIEWRDEGIVLAARPHGEDAAVVQLLTRERGKHAGLVRGGQSKKQRGMLQPGNRVDAEWRARLADHLGNLSLEATDSPMARLLDDSERLVALSAATALAEQVLPERVAHPAAFEGTAALLAALEGDHWAEALVQWELLLLRELGFGLDLTQCAGGGPNDQLAYVSPRTGRAVSLSAGEPYRDKLLALPGFLAGHGGGGPAEVAQGLELTGWFLRRTLLYPSDRDLPESRRRLADRFRRKAGLTPPPEDADAEAVDRPRAMD
jgi:DNA repair protein RecO (recombination protein O)